MINYEIGDAMRWHCQWTADEYRAYRDLEQRGFCTPGQKSERRALEREALTRYKLARFKAEQADIIKSGTKECIAKSKEIAAKQRTRAAVATQERLCKSKDIARMEARQRDKDAAEQEAFEASLYEDERLDCELRALSSARLAKRGLAD